LKSFVEIVVRVVVAAERTADRDRYRDPAQNRGTANRARHRLLICGRLPVVPMLTVPARRHWTFPLGVSWQYRAILPGLPPPVWMESRNFRYLDVSDDSEYTEFVSGELIFLAACGVALATPSLRYAASGN
jgi:hypothetical protein